MNTDKKRWAVLAACCLVNLCLGSVYAWSVFSAALAEYFTNTLGMAVTAGDLAIVYTIANSVGPITMITGGWFNDKFGPKKVILVGSIMWGLGTFFSGFAKSIGLLVFTYGIVGGLGLGMAYGCAISTCVKYFPDKRGLIGGITTAVYGLGSVIISPVVTAIVKSTDVTFTFKAVGIAFLVISVVSVFFIEKCPDGYVPSGYTPPASGNRSGPADVNWQGMLRTPVFYVMLILLTCGAFSGMMVVSQASSVAQNMIGMTAAAASIAVSVLALFNAFGRIAAGFISDKIGRINTLMVACILGVCGLLCLYNSKEGAVALFYVGVSAVGMSFGSFMGVYPGFTADRFGAKNNSVNYGIMFIGFALAGYFGPQIMRGIYASSGAYQGAFLVAGVFSIMGIVFTFIYRILNKK